MVTLNCRILSGQTSTWYCMRSPPIGITCDTPFTLISLRLKVKSAMVRKSIGEVLSLVIATSIICPIMELIGPNCGVIPSGISTVCSFSAVNCLALYTSVSQSNSTNTIPRPGDATERTTSTPGAPFKAVSTGRLACVSTSSGAIPPASKKMVTLGRFRSGSTSTGRFTRVNTPYTIMSAANATTNSLFRNENCISLFSIIYIHYSVLAGMYPCQPIVLVADMFSTAGVLVRVCLVCLFNVFSSSLAHIHGKVNRVQFSFCIELNPAAINARLVNSGVQVKLALINTGMYMQVLFFIQANHHKMCFGAQIVIQCIGINLLSVFFHNSGNMHQRTGDQF